MFWRGSKVDGGCREVLGGWDDRVGTEVVEGAGDENGC